MLACYITWLLCRNLGHSGFPPESFVKLYLQGYSIEMMMILVETGHSLHVSLLCVFLLEPIFILFAAEVYMCLVFACAQWTLVPTSVVKEIESSWITKE